MTQTKSTSQTWDLLEFDHQVPDQSHWVKDSYFESEADSIAPKFLGPSIFGALAILGAAGIWFLPKPVSMIVCILFFCHLSWISLRDKNTHLN